MQYSIMELKKKIKRHDVGLCGWKETHKSNSHTFDKLRKKEFIIMESLLETLASLTYFLKMEEWGLRMSIEGFMVWFKALGVLTMIGFRNRINKKDKIFPH